jgi:peptidoglycan/xylan/chitin deacetylase (PgdA/CDA1 family)
MKLRDGEWKKWLKTAFGWVIYKSGLHRLWLRDRAFIVLFHRVDDELRDNAISCSSQAFEAYCRFLGRYFDVVPLAELLGRLKESKPIGGAVAITFDDGYKDNREVAAPILERHGLSACFFIATDFIDTDRVGWWDAEVGVRSRWMSWDDVRALDQRDFEIAAHTKSHADLGEVWGETARAEIAGSALRIEAELGRPVTLFSFPYGRRDNLTEANRNLVRESGLQCCCAAYGGDVRPDSDPFDLRRFPVSPWYVSPYHLGFELLREPSSGQ